MAAATTTTAASSGSAPPLPQSKERISEFVSPHARLITGSDSSSSSAGRQHEIVIGRGSVIHPFVTIDASKGPIHIGEYCVFEEGATIVNEVSSKRDPQKRMLIGSYNYFGPRSDIRSCSIGTGNRFLADASTGTMSMIGDNCTLHIRSRVTHDVHLPDCTAVVVDASGASLWLPREHADLAAERDEQIKTSRLYRSILRGSQV